MDDYLSYSGYHMRSSYLFVNELRLHYLRWNADPESRPVILLHGLASNARIWELVGSRLSTARLAVFAPDARGHGLTDKPQGDYGFDDFYKDLAAFIETVGAEQPLLIGHSWGALVALDYSARRPFGPFAPAGLILVDGGMIQLDDSPDASWEQVRSHLTPPQLAGMPLEKFTAMLKDYQSRWMPDEDTLQIMLANFEVDEQEQIYPRLNFENHMKIVRAMWEFKTYERYAELNCPVLMVPVLPESPLTKSDEGWIAAKQRGIAHAQALISDLRLHWMENSIHDIPLQRPQELADLIAAFSSSLRTIPRSP
jgi:pimeloyl-ACP methyl ester carboxylesterase